MDRDIEMQLLEAEEFPVPPLSLESLVSLHSVTFTENEEAEGGGKVTECASFNLRERIHGIWNREEEERLLETAAGGNTEGRRHQGQQRCSNTRDNETKLGKVTRLPETEHFLSQQGAEEDDENKGKITADNNRDFCDFTIISRNKSAAKSERVSSTHSTPGRSDCSCSNINHSNNDCCQGRNSDRNIEDFSDDNTEDCSSSRSSISGRKNIKIREPASHKNEGTDSQSDDVWMYDGSLGDGTDCDGNRMVCSTKDDGCRYGDGRDGGNVGEYDSYDSNEDGCSHREIGSRRDRGSRLLRSSGSRSPSDRSRIGDGGSELRRGRSSHSRRNGGSYIATDSDEEGAFDLVHTLRRYRPRRRVSSSSSSCDCESCASRSDGSFFSDEEGPPGGEKTLQRRVAVWLETAKYFLGIVLYGLLVVFAVVTGVGVWTYYRPDDNTTQLGSKLLKWAVPMVVVCVLVTVAWRVLCWWLLTRGYNKGGQLIDRRQVIELAQRQGLVYTIRGAIYAPTSPDPRGENFPLRYQVVGYDSEYDTDSYFNSDLEEDGQYRKNLTPWRQEEDPIRRDRRNVYTRKAWFRDVPIVWFELLTRRTTQL